MCENEKKDAETIVKKIKRLLYNYDLAIVEAKGQLGLRQAAYDMYKNDNRKFAVRKFLSAKIDIDRLNIYIEKIQVAKNDLYDGLNLELDKYNPRYRQVFTMYFLDEKSYTEIAYETKYSRDAIKKIIQKLKKELLEIYTCE